MRLGDLNALKKEVEKQRKPKVYSEADERQNIIVDCILYMIDNTTSVDAIVNTKDEIRDKMFFINEENSNQPVAVIRVADICKNYSDQEG